MAGVQRVYLQLTDGDDRTCVWESGEVRVMRVRLAVGEALPTHAASAHVLFLPLAGSVQVATPEGVEVIGAGDAATLAPGVEMTVSNAGAEESVFLVVRAAEG